MGNPLLDMLVLAKEDLLQKYGLDANNACLAEDKHQPLYHELVDKYEVEYMAGGAVQNSLRVAQVLPRPSTTSKLNNIFVFSGFFNHHKWLSFLGVLVKTNLVTF
jgi:adenosine kinase